MERIPDGPREMWVIKRAREFIKATGICSLPVDPAEVARRCGWRVFTVKEVARLTGLTRWEILSAGQESDVFYCNGKYCIVYDELSYYPRARYSIGHEMGHIVLGHLEQFDKTCLLRSNNLTALEYWVLEREAEIFAAELLMPLPILRALGRMMPEFIKPEVIMKMCHVSLTTASIRCNEINRSFALDDLSDDDWMQQQFSTYLQVWGNYVREFKVFETHREIAIARNEELDIPL